MVERLNFQVYLELLQDGPIFICHTLYYFGFYSGVYLIQCIFYVRSVLFFFVILCYICKKYLSETNKRSLPFLLLIYVYSLFVLLFMFLFFYF